ncbi:kinase-like protein, partial [Thelephora ganbajun]
LNDLDPSSDASRKCLCELRTVCGTRAILPTSCMVSTDLLEIDSDPFALGGFDDVYRGTLNDSWVCIRRVRAYTEDASKKAIKRFCKEVVTWKTLRHPNVLPLMGVTMTEKRFVMMSEWMENGNINTFIKTHDDVNRLELLGDVTTGLIYMHDQGIVHGDLKGANILINRDGHACIADFSLLTVISNQQTFLSTCIGGGTIPWMSPELLDPESFGLKKCRLTVESDCYALGMVIYEVLGGRAPFAPSMIPVLKIISGERPQKPQGAQGVWFADSIWGVLELCWKPQPNDRPSLSTVLRCLQNVTRPPGPSYTGEDVETNADDQSDVTTVSSSSTFPLVRLRFQTHLQTLVG